MYAAVKTVTGHTFLTAGNIFLGWQLEVRLDRPQFISNPLKWLLIGAVLGV
jgi:hypothetical protein